MPNQTQCIYAEASVLDIFYNIIRSFHLIFGIIILILILKIVWYYKIKPLKLHTNLVILVANILILNALFVLSFIGSATMNFIVLFTYKNPCDCLTQVWVVYLIRIPFFIYVAGSPLFHFAIMIERVLATIFVRIYENKGKNIAVVSTIIVWSLNSLFALYVYLSSKADVDTFSHPMVYINLTSIYNSQILIIVHYFFLGLVIFIAITDYVLICRNKLIKSDFFSSVATYSLSQSYQAKQNILVMKIIFPLDFSYTFVFSIYNILSGFIRSRREESGQLIYVRTYDGITLLLFVHSIITLLVYNYFLIKQNDLRQNFIKTTKKVTSEMYFKKLNNSWK